MIFQQILFWIYLYKKLATPLNLDMIIWTELNLVNKVGIRIFRNPNPEQFAWQYVICVERYCSTKTIQLPQSSLYIFPVQWSVTLNTKWPLWFYRYAENHYYSLVISRNWNKNFSTRSLGPKFLGHWKTRMCSFPRLLLCFWVVEMYSSFIAINNVE